MSPHTNKLWREDRADEVIGPVDNGERIMAKNGARSRVKGMDLRSKPGQHILSVFIHMRLPSTSRIVLFSSWNPPIRSPDFSSPWDTSALLDGVEIRRPKLLPKPESREFTKCVPVAHRAFLRIAAVTDRISVDRTCLWDTILRVESTGETMEWKKEWVQEILIWRRHVLPRRVWTGRFTWQSHGKVTNE